MAGRWCWSLDVRRCSKKQAFIHFCLTNQPTLQFRIADKKFMLDNSTLWLPNGMEASVFIESDADRWVGTGKDKLELFVFSEVDVVTVSSVSKHYRNDFLKRVVQRKPVGDFWVACRALFDYETEAGRPDPMDLVRHGTGIFVPFACVDHNFGWFHNTERWNFSTR